MLGPGYKYFDVGRTESLAIVGATAESRALPFHAEIVAGHRMAPEREVLGERSKTYCDALHQALGNFRKTYARRAPDRPEATRFKGGKRENGWFSERSPFDK